MPQQPLQPLYKDAQGVVRFRANAIVQFLLENGPHDLNSLAARNFSPEDQEQFAQLIGYSLGGFGDLSYVRTETYTMALRQVKGKDGKDARIAELEEQLATIRKAVEGIIPVLFHFHITPPRFHIVPEDQEEGPDL
jgi:GMP synthase PP-ATPase subunit